MKKSAIIIVILLLLSPLSSPAARAERVENIQVFGTPALLDDDEGRTLLKCLAGWKDFLSASFGTHYQDVLDYLGDFFLWPSHYADVAVIEQQANKARYGVMSAFLQCDLERLKPVTNAYYKLEAELYYLRHFVDYSSGAVVERTKITAERSRFMNEMIDYFLLRKIGSDESADRLMFGNFFDLFEATYSDRAKTYASFARDPIWNQLAGKWDELKASLKGFNELGHEFSELGKEAIVEPATSAWEGIKSFEKPGNALAKLAMGIANRFDICAETDDKRYCLTDLYKGDDDKKSNSLDKTDTGPKRTFEQVNMSIRAQQETASQDVTEAQMRSRYELLYGSVGGDGVSSVVQQLDKLIELIGGVPYQNEPGPRLPAPNTLDILEGIEQCAEDVLDKTCE